MEGTLSSLTETQLLPGSIKLEPAKKDLKESSEVDGLLSSFSSVLKNILKNTNDLQLNSQELSRKFVLGEVTNVHEVMLAIQKAQLALEFTVEVKNQLLRAYSSLERMQ